MASGVTTVALPVTIKTIHQSLHFPLQCRQHLAVRTWPLSAAGLNSSSTSSNAILLLHRLNPVANDALAVLCDDALRVELHALYVWVLFVHHGHNGAVLSPRGHLKVFRAGLLCHQEAVVTRCKERTAEASPEGAAAAAAVMAVEECVSLYQLQLH